MADNKNEIAYEKVNNFLLDRVSASEKLIWRKPWLSRDHKNFCTGHVYQGSNIWILNIISMLNGYTHPLWAGFKQITDAGGSVKGQTGTPIIRVFSKKYPEKDGEGNEVWVDGEQQFFNVLKMNYVYVWNIEQTGLDPEDYADETDNNHAANILAEDIVNGYINRPEVHHGGNRASYSPKKDKVFMPRLNDFHSPENYYSTLYHELIHSTGHSSRLNRDGIVKDIRFGSERYSEEELVAELGACYLNNLVGIDSESVMDNSAAYVQGWSKKLRENPKWFIKAASQAENAVKFVLGERV